MKLDKAEVQLKTTIIGAEDNTYEIIRELSKNKGEEVIVIQVYPTIGMNNPERIDSTALHLINKMQELGWSKVHMMNLFSRVFSAKPLASHLKGIDRDNIDYIKKVVSSASPQIKIVICWGNSLATNKAANESKLEILQFISTLTPKRELFQIVTDGDEDLLDGTHILYLGLRHSLDTWSTEPYPLEHNLKHYGYALSKNNKLEEKTKDRQEASEKGRKGHKNPEIKIMKEESEDVLETDEQA